ncbi:MAG: phage holin family protein [Pararhodobacter sp.]
MQPEKTEGTVSLLGTIVEQLSGLIRSELHLAKAETEQNIKAAAVAVGFIVAALVIFITALNVLAGAIVAGLAELGLQPGWSALIVGVIFAVIAYALLHKGMNDLKLSSIAPTRTAENVKRDARAVKGA